MNAQLQPTPSPEFKLLIGGRLVAGAFASDVTNPATEQAVASCPRADLTQLRQWPQQRAHSLPGPRLRSQIDVGSFAAG